MTRSAGSVGLRDFPRLVTLRRAAARREELMRSPDLNYLFWEATLRCNLRCGHCGSSCEGSSPFRELETGEILRILDTIAEDFDASRIFVSVTGGEPLLRHDLFEVVARMTRLGMTSCIVTNGTLLSSDAAARLLEAGMRVASISVDGDEARHEAVRGRGTYRRTLEALTRAREAGFDDVEAITCVRPENLELLSEMEGVLRAAGANLWRLITIDRMGRLAEEQAPDMWLEPPQVRRLLDFVAARRDAAERAGEDWDVGFSCGGFLGVRRELRVRTEEGQCYAGLCVGSILCDGQVSACPSLPRTWAQGSAREARFSTIWRTRFQDFRGGTWRRGGPCAACSLYDVCLGGGLHERLAQPDSFCWIDRQDG